DGLKAEETKVDYRNKVMTVVAEPNVDISQLDLTIQSPSGTTIERVDGKEGDYSSEALYRITLANGGRDLDFADGVKAKYWKLKVLRDSELLDVSGYNLQHQLSD